MPQFDFYAFSSQIFWSLLLFYIFYYVFNQIFLPKVAEVLKWREKRKVLKKTSLNSLSLFSIIILYII